MVLVSEKILGQSDAANGSATADAAPDKLMRTFRTRAYLSKAGHQRLDEILAEQCLLYNAALEERSTAWKGHKIAISLYDQGKSLTQVRGDFPDIEGAVDRRIQVGTPKRLDKAYAAFFRRVKSGDTPGHPRFKSRRRWKTLDLYSGASRYVRYDADKYKGVVRIKGLPGFVQKLPFAQK